MKEGENITFLDLNNLLFEVKIGLFELKERMINVEVQINGLDTRIF